MKLLLSVGLTLLAVVSALCSPINDDGKLPYALAKAYLAQMFENNPETQRVTDTYYYKGKTKLVYIACLTDHCCPFR